MLYALFSCVQTNTLLIINYHIAHTYICTSSSSCLPPHSQCVYAMPNREDERSRSKPTHNTVRRSGEDQMVEIPWKIVEKIHRKIADSLGWFTKTSTLWLNIINDCKEQKRRANIQPGRQIINGHFCSFFIGPACYIVFLCFFHLLIRVDMCVWLSTHRNNSESEFAVSSTPTHRLELCERTPKKTMRILEAPQRATPPTQTSAHWVSSPIQPSTRNVRFFSCFFSSLCLSLLRSFLCWAVSSSSRLKRTILHPKSPHGYEQQAHIRQQDSENQSEWIVRTSKVRFVAHMLLLLLCVFFLFSTIVSAAQLNLHWSEKVDDDDENEVFFSMAINFEFWTQFSLSVAAVVFLLRNWTLNNNWKW